MKILSYFYLVLVASALGIMLSSVRAEDQIYEWTKTIGGPNSDWAWSVKTDESGNIFLAGEFSSTVDFDPGPITDLRTSFGLRDIYISKYDSSGNYEWTRTFGGPLDDTISYSIDIDRIGNVFIAGGFQETVDFDPGDETDYHVSSGGSDIFLSKYSSDGTCQWTRTVGGLGNDRAFAVSTSTSDDVYIAGQFTNSVDFDPGVGIDSHISAGGSDNFLSKFASDGNYQWTRTVGGISHEFSRQVAVDPSDFVYITGQFVNSVDFDPGVGIDSHVSAGGYDIFLSKYSNDGTYQWTKTVGGTNSDILRSAAIDSAGNVYLTGDYMDAVDFNPGIDVETKTSLGGADVFISKYSSDGTSEWTRTFGGATLDWGIAVATDYYSNIYVTGLYTGTVDFDPGPKAELHTDLGSADIYITKYDKFGQYKWTKTLEGSGNDGGQAIFADDSGNLFVAGVFQNNAIDFDPSSGIDSHANNGDYDIFLTKYAFDSTAPKLTITGATLINTTSSSYVVTATDSQASILSIEYQIDGTGSYWKSCTAQNGTYDELEEVAACDLSSLSDGIHAIYFRATDIANNVSQASSVTLTVDTIHPSLPTQTAPIWSNRTDTLTPPFSGTGDAGETVRVWLDNSLAGMATIDSSGNWTWTPSSNLSIGSHSIEFSVIDVAGNESPRTQSRNFQIVDDYDNDGLTTAEETAQGTDPHNADTDHDGSSDSEELANGTNPLDRGSVLPTREKTLCAEWNGFLGMWNVLEHVNTGSTKLNLTSTLQDYSGSAQTPVPFSLKAGYQSDLLVHGMTGFQANRYGLICSTATNGQPGDLDGRMVFYKPDAATGGYQFAFAMPLGTGLIGPQSVPYNTYQPSLDPVDASNLAANWIQLTNRSTVKQTGTLVFYDREGVEITRQAVTLKAGARFDYSAHDLAGLKQVGLVAWRPASTTAKFQLRNVRYYYRADGVTVPLGDDFESAFQLEGLVGSGQVLTVPLDTANASSVLEIANTLNEEVKAEVSLYAATGGTALHHQTYQLKPHATYHLITDAILNGRQGIATVQGNKPGSVIATAMQYGRTETLGIQTVYGIQASEPLGTVMRGSYNTYLKQGCRLLMANPTSAEAIATVSMKRYDGTTVLYGNMLQVPAHGLTDYDLCAQEQENVYGVVTVQPQTPNAIFATVLRLGEKEQYRFPTPVRE